MRIWRIANFANMLFAIRRLAFIRIISIIPTRLLVSLPREVGEGFVRFRHFMHDFPLFHGRAFTLDRRQKFHRQFLSHRLAFPVLGGIDQPAAAQGEAAVAPYLIRDLVIGAADTPAPDFEKRR